MTFFFDHNLSPNLADALNLLGIRTTYLSKEFPKDAADTDWMPVAVGRGYVVITCDRNIQKRQAEREVYRRMKLRGVFLAPAFSKMRVREIAKWLLWRWDDIERTMEGARPGESYLLRLRGKLARL